jgi:hypothetical protein
VTSADGLVIVDKPPGLTSHDVVARLRRLTGTRRVGHGGTLDPMATGVLVAGIGKATRLLGHLALAEKEYQATIRLGQATSTADAEGEVISGAPAGALTLDAVRAAARPLTGDIQQVPPAVSAVKVAGTRAYRLARAGTTPVLAPRAVPPTGGRSTPWPGLRTISAHSPRDRRHRSTGRRPATRTRPHSFLRCAAVSCGPDGACYGPTRACARSPTARTRKRSSRPECRAPTISSG